jgi:hypothetical protein
MNKQAVVLFLGISISSIIVLIIDFDNLHNFNRIGMALSSFVSLWMAWFVCCRVIILDDDKIYSANVFFNKFKIYRRMIYWKDVDKVLKVAQVIYHVYPKVPEKELYKFSSPRAIVIGETSWDYKAILRDVVKHAPQAEIDDHVRKIVNDKK